MSRQSLDDVHGATLVCRIGITMDRMGNVRVDGAITDEEIALLMIDTARDVIKSYHARRRAGTGSQLIVPAYDTALVGTDAEKKLLAARHELADAMEGT
jgi:hypothetical protein